MTEGILAALDVIEKATGEKKVNAVGYCVGGTLLAITLAHMAASGDERDRQRHAPHRADRFRVCRRPEDLRRAPTTSRASKRR